MANPASASQKLVAKAIRRFAKADEKHRAWLLDAAECFLAKKPMPVRPPSKEEIEAARLAELRRDARLTIGGESVG